MIINLIHFSSDLRLLIHFTRRYLYKTLDIILIFEKAKFQFCPSFKLRMYQIINQFKFIENSDDYRSFSFFVRSDTLQINFTLRHPYKTLDTMDVSLSEF